MAVNTLEAMTTMRVRIAFVNGQLWIVSARRSSASAAPSSGA
jgi:hypothetical protein